MKWKYFLIFLLAPVVVFSQKTISAKKKAFDNCRTDSCKISNALEISEEYLIKDKTKESQKWLDYSKRMLLKFPDERQQYSSNSLQSEIFYYSGLFQFGVHEAQKAIAIAKKSKDSLYLSNAYLMEGINWYEMGKTAKAEVSFHKAKKAFPEKPNLNSKRYQNSKQYIYNDLAQLKIKNKEFDSAYFYNKRAYGFAINLDT